MSEKEKANNKYITHEVVITVPSRLLILTKDKQLVNLIITPLDSYIRISYDFEKDEIRVDES